MKADRLILGNIITMDDVKPRAKAMAVKDGKIMYVGTERMARKLCDEKTQIMDYGKNCIYPGFMDGHCHGVLTGWRAIGIADVSAGNSYEEYCALMKAYVESHPEKNYYVGSGWIEKTEGTFTRECLDAISRDKSILLQSNDGHSMLLNSKALEVVGLDKETAKTMQPGEVDYDSAGELNGMVHEGPAKTLMANMPMTPEEVEGFILKWQEIAFSHGFTGAAEAGSKLLSPLQNEAYTRASRSGKLKLRTYSYHTVSDNTETPEQDVEEAWKLAQELNTEHHKIIGVKTFLDGVIEARTAWMQKEYLDEPGYYGVSCFNDHEKMVRLIKAAAGYDLEVHCHTMGDGAAKFILDCIEEAQAETGNMDQRNCLAHLEFVSREDIRRMAETNTVAVTAPTWAFNTKDTHDAAEKCVGAKMLECEYPIRSFLEAGALTSSHSDYSAGPFFDVPLSVFMACNRYHPELEFMLNSPAEAISRKQVLELMTKNVAKQFKEEQRLGTLEIGKIANASVFDTDFLSCPNEDIMKAKIVATIVDGEEVYRN